MTGEAQIAVALAGTGAQVRPASPPDSVGGVQPSCVATPTTLDQAAGVMQAAAGLELAVVPRGGGRTISWGAAPARCDVIADMAEMDRILEYAAGDLVVRVEAGVRLGQLAEVLAEKGQRLALDGAPADTVGGVVARNAAGPLRLRYGLPRDLLIGLTIVRADGHVARAGGKVVKNVAGYDLGKLFAGSHGTLGLIVEATFRLHPVPELSAYVTEEYAASAAAAEAVLAAAASPLQPSAVELERPRPGGPIRVATLLEGTPSGVSARAERMRTALGRGATSTLAAPDWWGRIGEAPPAGTTRPGYGGGRDAGAGGVLGRGTAPGAGRDRHRGHQHRGGGGGERLGRGRRAVRAAARGRRRRAGRGVRAGAAGRDRPWCHAGQAGADGPARGSVVVLTAPAAVRDQVDLWGPVPSLGLMRAVKQQFDPRDLMSPGRGPGGI